MLDESRAAAMCTEMLTVADAQADLGDIGDQGRTLLAQGFTTASADRSSARDAAMIRNGRAPGVRRLGRSGCAEYRQRRRV